MVPTAEIRNSPTSRESFIFQYVGHTFHVGRFCLDWCGIKHVDIIVEDFSAVGT
jgi:hypothetical protein